MLRRSLLRQYYHDFAHDFVPPGQQASRFQSAATPSVRSNAVREYLLAPAFGRPAPRLATLAVRCHTRREFFLRGGRDGLLEAVRERCFPSAEAAAVFAESGAQLSLGVLLECHKCPWGSHAADRGNRNLPRVMAQFGIEPRNSGIEVSILFRPESKMDDDAANEQQEEAAELEQTKRLEAMFEVLQKDIVSSVVGRKELALSHGIVGAIPWSVPEAPEGMLELYHGKELPDAQIMETLERWSLREELALLS